MGGNIILYKESLFVSYHDKCSTISFSIYANFYKLSEVPQGMYKKKIIYECYNIKDMNYERKETNTGVASSI